MFLEDLFMVLHLTDPSLPDLFPGEGMTCQKLRMERFPLWEGLVLTGRTYHPEAILPIRAVRPDNLYNRTSRDRPPVLPRHQQMGHPRDRRNPFPVLQPS